MFGKFNEPTKLYAKACCDVAKEAGTDSVDFFSAMMNQKVIIVMRMGTTTTTFSVL